MQQGPVLRNSLVVGLPTVIPFVIYVILALVLPLDDWARAADGPASPSDQPATKSAGKSDAAPDAGSGASPQKETADSREISMLIRQLGDPAYNVRQRATKRLIELGIVTQPLLTQALDDDDAEVRSRAGQVLTQVVEADFHFRLEAFANDLEGRQQHTLPCWGRFSQVFGQDKVSRILFVEMQKSEPALLEALDNNPKLASELLVMRIQSILQSLQLPPRDGSGQPTIALGTICTLLFVSAADGVTVSDQDASQLLNLIQPQAFRSNLSAHAGSGILKKMLGAWIVHNSGSALAHQTLTLAFTHDLKEGLDLAVKLLANDAGAQQPAVRNDALVRHDALIAIGRFGNHEHIAVVEPWLKDTSSCLQQPQQANEARQPQIRDVALAVLIHLSGQELKDYGLDHVQLTFQTLPQCGSIAFADPLMRKAALRKWEQWAGRSGAGGADKPGSQKDAPNQPADGQPAAPGADRPGLPAGKDDKPAAPRPAELAP